jgi:parvulin-like peptidyl-prolyl isomerase
MFRQVLLPLLLASAALASAAGEVREEVLVVVNGHVITRRTLQQSVEQEHAALYRQFSGKELDKKLRDAREKTLSGLVDAFLIEDKADDLGLRQTVNTSISARGGRHQAATNAFGFDHQGIGLQDFIKFQRRQILSQEVMRREVFSKVAVEDQELRAWYEDHKDEYRQPSRFRIRELVLAKGGTPEEQQAARGVLAKVQEALKKGGNFEDMVKEHSSSPSKSTGGDLGWIGKGFLRPAIENAAMGLKPGEVPSLKPRTSTWCS